MPGDGAQHLVPGAMAVGVVDLLEAVEVDQADAELPSVAPGARELAGESLLEHAPVGQAGQGVVAAGVVMLLEIGRVRHVRGDHPGQEIECGHVLVAERAGPGVVDLQHAGRPAGVDQRDTHHRHGADPATGVEVDSSVGGGIGTVQRPPLPHAAPGQTRAHVEAQPDISRGRATAHVVDHLIAVGELDDRRLGSGQHLGPVQDERHDRVEVQRRRGNLVLGLDDREQAISGQFRRHGPMIGSSAIPV